MTTKAIIYWSTTAIIAFVWLSGGGAELMHVRATIDGLVELGYPAYFPVILGFWKVLAAPALLIPRFPRLKEWAYAGTIFELTGAVASQIFVGGSVRHILVPAIFAVCAIVSWALRPPSRVLGELGELFPTEKRA